MQICFCNLEDKIITTCDSEYEKARQEWNRSIQKYPVAIVYCETKYDVREAICLARKCKRPIRIRSGGHNYEGYSTGDGVLVIDVSKMKSIELDENKNTITIEAGIQNQELYNFISSKGYPFPGGTCPTVGVSGYALGGGWGLSARYFGLGCDSLLEIQMVDYTGNILTVNKQCHSDLFWALRGAGGGNFGVIVALTFKLPPKVEKVTVFNVYYPNASKDTQFLFLDTWQKWITEVDNKINMQGGIYNTEKDGIFAYGRGICYGTEVETKDLLGVFYKIPGGIISMRYITFLEAINEIESQYPQYEHFKSTGRFVHKQFDKDQLERLISIVNQQRPEDSITISIGVYGLGGIIKTVKPNETAFYYREANYIINIQSVWQDNAYREENIEWVMQQFKYIYEMTKGSYINFPYLELRNYEKEYFGQNKCCLQKIKEKYDPYQIFNFPQSIKI